MATATQGPEPTLAPGSKCIRVAQVAAYLSMSRSGVYLMMSRGDLPFVKIGRSRRVRLEDVERLVKSSTIGTTAP